MKKSISGTDDRSKVRKPIPKKYFGMNNVPESLMENIRKTVGEPEYEKLGQYSDNQIIKFFKHEKFPARYFRCKSAEEEQESKQFCKGILALTQLHSKHHKNVIKDFRGRFNKQELECIFKAFSSLSMANIVDDQKPLKEVLYEFLRSEQNDILDLEEVGKLKSEIKSIHPIVFDIFIDSILTLSTIKKQSDMIRYFKKN